LVPGSVEDRESKSYQKSRRLSPEALNEVCDDQLKNLRSGSRNFVLVDELATSNLQSNTARTIECTFNASGQIIRVIKKSRIATGEQKEIVMFPLEQYLDPSVQKYLPGTQEQELIQAF
jgi:hypothetical protein